MVTENISSLNAKTYTFSFVAKPPECPMMQVPIIVYGNIIYRHQTTNAYAFLNQTQLPQRQNIHSQEHIP
jgi:hypothetical protein